MRNCNIKPAGERVIEGGRQPGVAGSRVNPSSTNKIIGTKDLENNKRYNFISKTILSNLIVVKLQECPRLWFVRDPRRPP